MKYPNQLIELENELSIYMPDAGLVKSSYDQLLAINAAEPFPFWAKLWPASKALSQFLINNPKWIQDKVVLEMGAGIGQPSLTIAKTCKQLVISDHNKDAVELIEKNILHFKLNNAKAMLLDWNSYNNSIPADTILLSDINYASEAFEPLLNTIEYYLAKGTVIIIATPQRIIGAPFIENLQYYIQQSDIATVLEKDTEVMISLYVLYK